jgi:tetratricopeptide (TPR) repeat protein
LAAAYAEAGDGPAALRALSAAAPHLDGVDAARVAGQRAYLLHQEGHLSEALAGYQEALELFRDLGDVRRQAIALHNIAVVHTHAGDLARAGSGRDPRLRHER